jgi:SAM-dependent methyltransferase
VGRVFAALNQFNERHPWSHNDVHAGWVLRQAEKTRRDGGVAALDIGCGAGGLLARLSKKFSRVVGVEADPATADAARSATRWLPNVRVVDGAFPIDDQRSDFVSLVAVLHHLPLQQGVAAARAAVAPGGRLVIVGVSREEDRVDMALSLVSVILNPVIGMMKHPRRAQAMPAEMTAPTAAASDTYSEIREVMREILPGVRMRRSLFWRYRAVWRDRGTGQ